MQEGIELMLSHTRTLIKDWQNIEERIKYKQLFLKIIINKVNEYWKERLKYEKLDIFKY